MKKKRRRWFVVRSNSKSSSSVNPAVVKALEQAAGCQLKVGVETLELRMLLSNVATWTGGGDGSSWTDPNNWSPEAVPVSTEAVFINTAPTNVNVTTNVTVQSITSNASLNITGSLSVASATSSVSGSLTVSAGASLTASGSGTSFTATGPTAINGADLYASNGATLSLPSVVSINEPSPGSTWSSSGSGSVLSFPNLTNYVSSDGYYEAAIQAISGGGISLPALTSISGDSVSINCAGASSTVAMASLTSFVGDSSGELSISVTNHGSLIWSAGLQSLNFVSITLDGTGALNTHQLTSLTHGVVTATGASDFSQVSNFNGSNAAVSNGASLALPAVLTYSVTAPGISDSVKGATWSATDVGSVLSFPNLTSYVSSDGYYEAAIQAISGGGISLPALTSISGDGLSITSTGWDSQLLMQSLVQFSPDVSSPASMTLTEYSLLVIPLSLSSLKDVTFTQDGTSTVDGTFDGLPNWLAPGSLASFNASTQILTVTGLTTIVESPQTDEPIITADGSAAQVIILGSDGPIIQIGGINLSDGAGADLKPAGSGALTTHNTLVVGTLGGSAPIFAVTGGSFLDLENNDMLVHSGSYSQINPLLQSGFANGNWTGIGIQSSTAASDTSHTTTLGVVINNDGTGNTLYGSGAPMGLFDGQDAAVNDVLVRYTSYGDANLDGKVDGTDYARIDNGDLTHLTGWFNGDFNYDGTVNGTDYTLIDNAFNRQAAPIASSPLPVLFQITVANNASGFQAQTPYADDGFSTGYVTAGDWTSTINLAEPFYSGAGTVAGSSQINVSLAHNAAHISWNLDAYLASSSTGLVYLSTNTSVKVVFYLPLNDLGTWNEQVQDIGNLTSRSGGVSFPTGSSSYGGTDTASNGYFTPAVNIDGQQYAQLFSYWNGYNDPTWYINGIGLLADGYSSTVISLPPVDSSGSITLNVVDSSQG